MQPTWGPTPEKGNNAGGLSDNGAINRRMILNISAVSRSFHRMRHTILPLALVAALVAQAAPAKAECYADYKAKRDQKPLKLHYGVAKIPDAACGGKSAAAEALAPRLAQEGWTLLNILSIFGPEGLDQRKDSAGKFFLRY